ncbi:hypothetical protein SNEBB_008250 [Seison nebaliae]|nr:hypothetical protein SNEBB_008250 [Seison nebaliae]
MRLGVPISIRRKKRNIITNSLDEEIAVVDPTASDEKNFYSLASNDPNVVYDRNYEPTKLPDISEWWFQPLVKDIEKNVRERTFKKDYHKSYPYKDVIEGNSNLKSVKHEIDENIELNREARKFINHIQGLHKQYNRLFKENKLLEDHRKIDHIKFDTVSRQTSHHNNDKTEFHYHNMPDSYNVFLIMNAAQICIFTILVLTCFGAMYKYQKLSYFKQQNYSNSQLARKADSKTWRINDMDRARSYNNMEMNNPILSSRPVPSSMPIPPTHRTSPQRRTHSPPTSHNDLHFPAKPLHLDMIDLSKDPSRSHTHKQYRSRSAMVRSPNIYLDHSLNEDNRNENNRYSIFEVDHQPKNFSRSFKLKRRAISLDFETNHQQLFGWKYCYVMSNRRSSSNQLDIARTDITELNSKIGGLGELNSNELKIDDNSSSEKTVIHLINNVNEIKEEEEEEEEKCSNLSKPIQEDEKSSTNSSPTTNLTTNISTSYTTTNENDLSILIDSELRTILQNIKTIRKEARKQLRMFSGCLRQQQKILRRQKSSLDDRKKTLFHHSLQPLDTSYNSISNLRQINAVPQHYSTYHCRQLSKNSYTQNHLSTSNTFLNNRNYRLYSKTYQSPSYNLTNDTFTSRCSYNKQYPTSYVERARRPYARHLQTSSIIRTT